MKAIFNPIESRASKHACREKLFSRLASLAVGILLFMLLSPMSIDAQPCSGCVAPTTIQPTWVAWNGPVSVTIPVGGSGGCTVSFCYFWREFTNYPYSGNKEYQSYLCPGTINYAPDNCGKRFNLDAIQEYLLQTAINNSALIGPCSDPYHMTNTIFRSMCWTRHNWCTDCSTTWLSCDNEALCKHTMDICYILGQVWETNDVYTTIGNPNCSDTLPTNPNEIENDHCYLFECSWQSVYHLP